MEPSIRRKGIRSTGMKVINVPLLRASAKPRARMTFSTVGEFGISFGDKALICRLLRPSPVSELSGLIPLARD